MKWTDVRWAVVKEDGSFAGVPCASYGEARDLAAQKSFFLLTSLMKMMNLMILI